MRLLALLVLLSCGPRAAAPATAPVGLASTGGALPSPDALLPLDPGVQSGTLDNGLRWFVEENPHPEKRVELRLVVRAGSVLEDDDQRGLAHFVEHMAFNGTEHFPGTKLVEFLQSVGMDFGAHLNAWTSFDETVYVLQLPSDDPELLDQGLLVLRDWAGGVAFDPVEVERERGVVLEEWRRSRGARGRIGDALRPELFKGSVYADRSPIGTEESLRGFDPAALSRFYGDWYRPSLMAVIVVGDVDTATMQTAIGAHFGDLADPDDARPRPDVAIPSQPETWAVTLTDPEMRGTSFGLTRTIPSREPQTHAGYRALLVRLLYSQAINERLRKLARGDAPPFLGAGIGFDRRTPNHVAQSAGAGVAAGGVEEGLEAVAIELERARRFGFSEAELDRARRRTLTGYEASFEERETTASGHHADEIIRHATNGEPMPGIAYELDLARAWVPGITQAEVAEYAAGFLADGGFLVHVVGPEGDALPSEEVLLATLARVGEMTLEPPEETETRSALMETLPEPGSVVEERQIPALGVTEWTLSNGMTVRIKPTDFKVDEVEFTAHSWGGTGGLPAADWVPASTASSLAGASGVADLDADALEDLLAGREASVSAHIGWTSESVSGSASVADLELALQLAHLRITQPRFDPVALARSKQSRTDSLRKRLADPAVRFNDAWNRVLWQAHPRMEPWTVESLEQMDLAQSEAIYTDRFAHFGDAAWTFVGSIEPDALRPLVERYIASLPGTGGGEPPGDAVIRPLLGSDQFTVEAGVEPQAQVRLRYGSEAAFTPDNRHALRSLASVLEHLMREELREARGGTYSVSVWASTEGVPVPETAITVQFACDPERVGELSDAARAVVERVRSGDIPADVVATIAAQQLRARETDERENGWWLGALSGNQERGEDPSELIRYKELSSALSVQSVQTSATEWLRDDRLVEGRLLPE